ncbi:hypothetical protein B0H17DRAFT_1072941 [Mycena rosella]|uniref:Zn(2)-C6 fungal-type domain-containing protein n=1 Tax=Mycena rosella TaxID=1033263 RepID=A0AAD7D924_MYCRO|nr:hypothetical protein B0H17DRAFT_1072941 [Mycena rosella]
MKDSQHSGCPAPFALKRRRTILACSHCRKRKIRCITTEQPPKNPCARCARRHLPCEYIAAPDQERDPAPPTHALLVHPAGSSESDPDSPPLKSRATWVPPLTAPDFSLGLKLEEQSISPPHWTHPLEISLGYSRPPSSASSCGGQDLSLPTPIQPFIHRRSPTSSLPGSYQLPLIAGHYDMACGSPRWDRPPLPYSMADQKYSSQHDGHGSTRLRLSSMREDMAREPCLGYPLDFELEFFGDAFPEYEWPSDSSSN